MIRSLIDLLRITKKLSSKNGLEWYRYIHTHSISGYLVLRLLPLHGLLHHLPRCPSPGSQYPPKLSLPTPPTTKPSPPHPSRCTTTSNLLWSNVFFFHFFIFFKESFRRFLQFHSFHRTVFIHLPPPSICFPFYYLPPLLLAPNPSS